MTAKRWEIINEEFISYTGGTAQLITNGECKVHLWETPKDAQLFCDKLNAINEENEQLKTTIQQLRTDNTKQKKLLNTTMKENEHIKTTIKDMINTERTEIGKMTLRQLWRQIQ